MKNTIVLVAVSILHTFLFAQAPQGINYQAVAYNNLGQPVTNQTVGVRLSVLEGSAGGTVLYAETQSPNTDNTGLFSIVIGNGSAVTGTFAGINWGNGNRWLKTEIDITGGNNYLVAGSSQFMSIPYAFFSDKAAFAVKTGFSSGSFTIPDGFNNVTTVVIPDSVNYTVPAGKNLYLPTAERTLAIDGDTLATNLSGGGANARTFVGASENSSIWIRYEPITGFLVDKTVAWATINLSTSPLTIPQGKQFVVVNSMYSLVGEPGSLYADCKVTINNIPSNLLSNTVLSEGTIISSSGCIAASGQINHIINGYFMDK